MFYHVLPCFTMFYHVLPPIVCLLSPCFLAGIWRVYTYFSQRPWNFCGHHTCWKMVSHVENPMITLWLCQNSYWKWPLISWVFPWIAWWCSIVFCKRLPEGNHPQNHKIFMGGIILVYGRFMAGLWQVYHMTFWSLLRTGSVGYIETSHYEACIRTVIPVSSNIHICDHTISMGRNNTI